MNPHPDPENFESLRRLLAMKRHEQPPPGYFDNFSRQVTARLRAGERPSFRNQLSDAPWLQRIVYLLSGKPAFAGAFGAAVCALLIGGIVYSEKFEMAATPAQPLAAGDSTTALVTPAAMAANQPLAATPVLVSSSSTNPVSFPNGSLFDQIALPSVEQVSFTQH